MESESGSTQNVVTLREPEALCYVALQSKDQNGKPVEWRGIVDSILSAHSCHRKEVKANGQKNNGNKDETGICHKF